MFLVCLWQHHPFRFVGNTMHTSAGMHIRSSVQTVFPTISAFCIWFISAGPPNLSFFLCKKRRGKPLKTWRTVSSLSLFFFPHSDKTSLPVSAVRSHCPQPHVYVLTTSVCRFKRKSQPKPSGVYFCVFLWRGEFHTGKFPGKKWDRVESGSSLAWLLSRVKGMKINYGFFSPNCILF